MSTNVHLTPALEKFAKDCVTEGRYNNVSEVVRSGLRLLQEAEERRRFMAMLEAIEAEIDRGEFVTHDEMMAELDAIIEAAE
ncbi:type II toxin-antitoxin system ParD family antitoxin [Caulobacter sp. BK020]|uniref:type II toxin-antitoxin system ParD family antitoxin n=1 Tax=Caulobacter sp. BK020 TaxID=2512117 RepID=UPI0010491CDF|nr:type II toxin-antitoxin system ParD family antitoxin [Caulobacter sp. BK020]TCS05915.1 antitoxin ParD1/3/4 [Caulobacter sp. BK020]